jgi:hypothetical protein
MLHACLYIICFVFCYTSWHFYVFSGTNLLTRCHSVSSLFSAIFVFQNTTREIFSKLDETKVKPSIFSEASRSPKMRQRRARSQAHPRAARPVPGSRRHQGGETSWSTLWRPPFAYIFPRREKPKGRIAFPRNILKAVAIVVARSGGSRSSSRHPAEGLLHHHGRLRSDVWVVYLGLRVHSSS